jgi:hypothetical protein
MQHGIRAEPAVEFFSPLRGDFVYTLQRATFSRGLAAFQQPAIFQALQRGINLAELRVPDMLQTFFEGSFDGIAGGAIA